MANHTVVPDKTRMKAFLAAGLTQQQIADAWNEETGNRVSRSAIAMAIGRYGLHSTRALPRHDDVIPWKVSAQHAHNSDLRILRLLGRDRKGLPLTDGERTRLANWLKDLREAGAVITYNPDTEQGFHWIERRPEHGDDVVDRTVA